MFETVMNQQGKVFKCNTDAHRLNINCHLSHAFCVFVNNTCPVSTNVNAYGVPVMNIKLICGLYNNVTSDAQPAVQKATLFTCLVTLRMDPDA